MVDTIVFIGEIMGTAAFALFGAMVAVERRMDLLGVLLLAITTAVGGGIIRDLLLGATPPLALQNPFFILIAVAVALLVFGVQLRKNLAQDGKFARRLYALAIFGDTLGLAVFTVTGVNRSIALGYGENAFLSIFVGVLTGVGGGVMRDVMASRIPMILRREIYAVASLAGGVLYYYLYRWAGEYIALFCGAAVIVAVRTVAVRYQLNLPVARSK
ncbi:MAG: trimeric intracellular cation channel family protein [Oscillospiraceae bacterium]|nr:trimeric intracellular cation channel family protein [Oscillospiraceae bacterium]